VSVRVCLLGPKKKLAGMRNRHNFITKARILTEKFRQMKIEVSKNQTKSELANLHQNIWSTASRGREATYQLSSYFFCYITKNHLFPPSQQICWE
jgi:hypothetical protein